jgi:hypothetical protein
VRKQEAFFVSFAGNRPAAHAMSGMSAAIVIKIRDQRIDRR